MARVAFDVGAADFERQVVELSRRVPVLVDFWAPWCGPCRTLKPLLEKLAEEYGGRFLLAKVNSDQEQALAQAFGVRSIPTVKMFVGGEMVDEFTGALPEQALREFIERWLPSPGEPAYQAACAARAAGDATTCEARLRQALDLDPRHGPARRDLALALLEAHRLDEAAALLEAPPDDPRNPVDWEALRARVALARRAGGGLDTAALHARIAANPADLAARLSLADALAAAADYRGALGQLLEVVRRDRTYEDDAGRKGMLRLFTMLAEDPAQTPLVREFRSALAGCLNR